jgi:acetyl-CoA C-acetyltransferase
MRKVAVSSWATSTFTKDSQMSLFELALEPSIQLIRQNGISPKEIDAVLFSTCATDQYSSAIISEMLWLLLLQLLHLVYVIQHW